MVRNLAGICLLLISLNSAAQPVWHNMSAAYGPLPPTIQVYKTTDSLDGKPFIAFYVKAKLNDKNIHFTADTSWGRRLTPSQFYEKHVNPLVVVNCTFFDFKTNRNLNVVIRNGSLLAYNVHAIPLKGKDCLLYRHPIGSAIGISKKRKADIAWVITDTAHKYAYAHQAARDARKKDSVSDPSLRQLAADYSLTDPAIENSPEPKKWKMETAVGGGPVLVQEGEIKITNDEEMKFAGKAVNDLHPRTCMGYTDDGYLIIMAIQGRLKGVAEGASLTQAAKLLVEVGCREAINLDGGGSSCLLVNGIETIKPSDKEGQRAVPAVFMIKNK